MKLTKSIILSISVLVITSCASYNTNFPLIDKGMTFSEVRDLIGKPLSAESGPEDMKIYYYRLASSILDTDGSDTREYYVLTNNSEVIGYGERTDNVTMMREIRQFNAAWNAVKAINNLNPNN